MAGGGRLKALSVTEYSVSSLPWMSVEEAGVGGRVVRDMVSSLHLIEARGRAEHSVGFWMESVC